MTSHSPDSVAKSSKPDRSSDPLSDLLHVMARLRDPENGCPWDVVQSFETIAPYTIEEAYEVSEAIQQKDMSALREELGDLLFQVVFHARMAEEEGHFTFHNVAEDLSRKMIRRHPHVFGEKSVESADAQTLHWEDIKAAERAEKKAARADQSILADVPLALPALMRAEKLQKRAARVGFDWPEALQVFDKIEEEIIEIKEEIEIDGSAERLRDEVGDLLFAVANLARHLKVDPEVALRGGNDKFEKRFRAVETKLGDELEAASLEEMEAAWQQVKTENG